MRDDDVVALVEKEKANMRAIQEQVFNDTVKAIDIAYEEFLQEHDLEDMPVVKAGYYSVLHQIITETPMPVGNIQKTVEDYVSHSIADSMNDMIEDIHLQFTNAVHRAKT